MKRKRESEEGNEEENEKKKRKLEEIPDFVITDDNWLKLPENSRKYWTQRYQIFEQFDKGCWLDEGLYLNNSKIEGLYTCAHEDIAKHISKRITDSFDKEIVILEGMCGNGGNLVGFAQNPKIKKIIAVDINPNKIKIARHNTKVYGIPQEKIEFIEDDFFNVIKSGRLSKYKIDVCFLSPPWGGPSYQEVSYYRLDMMNFNGEEDGQSLYKLIRDKVTPNVSYCLPRNTDKDEIMELLGEGETAEFETNFYNGVVKTKTAYFGKLCKILSSDEEEDDDDDEEDGEFEEEEK